ncbi:hypothetical protein E4U55_004590 [Claviceps digitariae]|nr:hypothetical protein E4U55_004590 [Claviceps digitariae]
MSGAERRAGPLCWTAVLGPLRRLRLPSAYWRSPAARSTLVPSNVIDASRCGIIAVFLRHHIFLKTHPALLGSQHKDRLLASTVPTHRPSRLLALCRPVLSTKTATTSTNFHYDDDDDNNDYDDDDDRGPACIVIYLNPIGHRSLDLVSSQLSSLTISSPFAACVFKCPRVSMPTAHDLDLE